jgi:hypothetical protein
MNAKSKHLASFETFFQDFLPRKNKSIFFTMIKKDFRPHFHRNLSDLLFFFYQTEYKLDCLRFQKNLSQLVGCGKNLIRFVEVLGMLAFHFQTRLKVFQRLVSL